MSELDKSYQLLNLKIDKLDTKLNAIYQILKVINSDSYTSSLQPKVPNPNPKQNIPDLVNKNEVDFESILDNLQNQASKHSVIKLRDNKYPTITRAQYNWITNL